MVVFNFQFLEDYPPSPCNIVHRNFVQAIALLVQMKHILFQSRLCFQRTLLFVGFDYLIPIGI